MNFYFAVLLFLQAILNVNCTSIVKTKGYTPLKINKVACTAEKLKSNGGRYTCDHKGMVHCSEGWKDESPVDDTNRCAEPICDAACDHGMCTSPNYCACEVGWDGTCCDICIPMPGCVNGKCRKEMVNGEEVEIAQTCDCDKWPADLGTALADKPQYTGAKCDMPNCIPACGNGGMCVIGGDTLKSAQANHGSCACPVGFMHDPAADNVHECAGCIKASGCDAVHGHCCHMTDGDDNTPKVPGSCCCDEGWTGPLCDQLECKHSDGSVIDCGEHGVCTAGIKEGASAGTVVNGCACEVGWQGENCELCVPYWDCPNKVVETTDGDFATKGYACKDVPNQCWCKDTNEVDPNNLCNSPAINGGAADPN